MTGEELREELWDRCAAYTPMYLDSPGKRGVVIHLLDDALKMCVDIVGIQKEWKRRMLLAWLFAPGSGNLYMSSKELTPEMWYALESFCDVCKVDDVWASLREGFYTDVCLMYEESVRCMSISV